MKRNHWEEYKEYKYQLALFGGKMKKIVHITFSDDTGGAAIAAYRLNHAMCEMGLDSKMVVFEKKRKGSDTNTIYQNTIESYLYKFKIYVLGERGFINTGKNGYYSFFSIGNPIWKNDLIKEADIVYLHWINRGFLNSKDILWLLKNKEKVIWVMHDMFPLTGGCHHALNCKQYKAGCRKCGVMRKYRCSVKRQFKSKLQFKNYDNMYWIAPSKWLYRCAEKAKMIDNGRLYHIPNPIDRNFFSIEKNIAKTALGLDVTKSYILYGGDNITHNPYKGYNYFRKMIVSLNQKLIHIGKKDVELLVFGTDGTDEALKKLPIPVVALGEVRDEKTMNLLYNASEVLVSTSIAENSPLVVQESVTCGTPVVAFNVGGISDFIRSDSDGCLVEDRNTDEMAECLMNLLLRKKLNKEERCVSAITEVVDQHRKVFSL